MAAFLQIPPERLSADALSGLLEEYASRDGTDYGEREVSLADKVTDLHAQLRRGELCLLFDQDSETWDLCPRDAAANLLRPDAEHSRGAESSRGA